MPEQSGDNAYEGLMRASLSQTLLTSAAEHEWVLLRELVDFADKLVVAFIFADRFPVRVLRARLELLTIEEGLPFRRIICDSARELREDALAKILAPTADHEVTWFEAFGSESDFRDAWFFAAQRWNEHREPLRRSQVRALIVAAPVWAKPVVRLAAPDLWSITNLVIEPTALSRPTIWLPLAEQERLEGTPAERKLIARRIDGILDRTRQGRELDLIDTVVSAVQAGAWREAKQAAALLSISPDLLDRLSQAAREKGLEGLFKLVVGLGQLQLALGEIGRSSEALRVAKRVVALCRELAASRPDRYSWPLAMSLNNLGNCCRKEGQIEDAYRAVEEAVAIGRKFAGTGKPEDLAMILANFSNDLTQRENFEEARKVAAEAVEIYRGLARTNPERFSPELTKSLNNLGLRWIDNGRPGNAMLVFLEAVEVARSLHGVSPDTRQVLLAGSLNNLGLVFGDLGHLEDSFTAAEESVAIMTALAREKPQSFNFLLRNWADSLADLLTAIHRNPSESKVLQEAFALLQRVDSTPSSELEPVSDKPG